MYRGIIILWLMYHEVLANTRPCEWGTPGADFKNERKKQEISTGTNATHRKWLNTFNLSFFFLSSGFVFILSNKVLYPSSILLTCVLKYRLNKQLGVCSWQESNRGRLEERMRKWTHQTDLNCLCQLTSSWSGDRCLTHETAQTGMWYTVGAMHLEYHKTDKFFCTSFIFNFKIIFSKTEERQVKKIN